MKIAFLSVFYPYRGGIAQFNACVYRELEKLHDVKAFTFTRQYPDFLFPGKTQYVGSNDKADKIPADRLLDSINPLSFRRTIKAIKKYDPDLLLIQNWMPFFGPSFGWVARHFKKRGTPVISIIANMIPHEPNPGDRSFNKFFTKNSDAFVVMANQVKDDLLTIRPDAKYIYYPHPNYEHFGEKTDKSKARNKLGLPDYKNIILFFGLIRKYKGLDLLIRAMKKTPDDFHLLIAGEVYGNEKEYYNLLEETLPDYKYTFINRYVNDDEVPLIFSSADVCALPYRTATQSGIIGISYHFGVPVITTDVGGLREVVEPFDTGIVIDKPDSGLLNNAITKYFSENLQPRFKENIGAFKKDYTWQGYTEKIIDLYNEIK